MSQTPAQAAAGARAPGAAGGPPTDGKRAGSRSRAVPWTAVVAAAFWVVEMTVVVPGTGLGWDESVYTSQVSGSVPAAFFSAPRARGVTFLAAPVAEFTTSVFALRAWMALLSGLGLWLALRAWRGLVPGAALALAGGFFATLWVTLSYGPAVMPNLWSAYGALAATGCFLRAARAPGDRWARAGLGAAVALTGLMRPPDAVWLVLPLAVAALFVPGARRRTLLWGVLAAGLLLGCGEWLIEAYVRYGGPQARLHRAEVIEGGTGWHFAVDDQIRSLDGRRLCRPCTVPWRHRAASVWWFALPLPVAYGALVCVRAGRARVAALSVAVATCMAVPYLFLIGYAAPRFLLPSYALLAVPIGCGLRSLLTVRRPGRTDPPRRRRMLLAGAVMAVLCAHVAVQVGVAQADAGSDRAVRRTYGDVAARLRAAGVRPPCVISGEEAVLAAFRMRCASRQVGGADASITAAGLAAAARTRPVVLLLPADTEPPAFARAWHSLPLPHSAAFPADRAYISPPPPPGTPTPH